MGKELCDEIEASRPLNTTPHPEYWQVRTASFRRMFVGYRRPSFGPAPTPHAMALQICLFVIDCFCSFEIISTNPEKIDLYAYAVSSRCFINQRSAR
jgi:hypothetical protein